jgi:tetratricopeptide (TPR) repeat protein
MSRMKWILGCSGVGTLVISGTLLLGLIVTPLVFRNLDPTTQDRLVRRLPFLADMRPTNPPALILPTAAATSAEALALLASSTPTSQPTNPPTVEPTNIPPSATLTLTNTSESASVQIVALAATEVPATEVPATIVPTTIIPTTVVPTTIVPPTIVSTTAVPTTAVSAAVLSTIPPTNTPRPSETAAPTSTSTPTHINPTATITPTETPTETPTIPFTPSITPEPIPAEYRLLGLEWEPQRFNNCGPANLVQVMRWLNWRDPQVLVASQIKPVQEDKNTSPWELARYANQNTDGQLRAIVRQGGSIDLLKRLIANEFAVIVETGYYDPEDPSEGWIGHYLTLTGYSDLVGEFTKLDSLKGPLTEPYAELDDLWADFNRLYMVIYYPQREAELMAILGADADENVNALNALERARQDAINAPGDAFAWFALGTSFTLLKQYSDAATAYDQAFALGLPERMLWYQHGPFEAYYHMGRYDRIIELATVGIERTEHVEEYFYWRGMAFAATGRTAEAIAEFNHVLGYNPFFTPASEALNQVQSGTFRAPGS